MNNIDIDDLRRLYEEEKLSVPTIAKMYNCSQWMLYKRMKAKGIVLRNQMESNRYTFESKPLSFVPKQPLTQEELSLKQAGLMLYWAEGSKRATCTVDFSNSDPEMIVIFTRCLREIYGVSEEKLRVFLYCHANQSVEQLVSFWSKLTGISTDQFTRPYIKHDAATKYHIMPYGLAHIRYNDQRLMSLIKSDMREVIKPMLGWWSGQSHLTVISSFPS